MNLLSAIIAGIVGTVVMTLVMQMAPRMGLPKMDIVGLLGSMFGAPGNRALGLLLHGMMGIVFALIYAALWAAGWGAPTWLYGLVFGAIHWLIVGAIMAGMPMLHAGIRSGQVPAPGAYMTRLGGAQAFMGGLMGHLLYGLVVAWLYGALAG